MFDTNVLVRALLLSGSKSRQALDLATRDGNVLLSFPVLVELYEVLNRSKFRKYVSEEDVRRFLAAFIQDARWVDVDSRITACRDPKDDKFLELAVSGHADYLVTGDFDLIALHPFRGIKIISPDNFLQRTKS